MNSRQLRVWMGTFLLFSIAFGGCNTELDRARKLANNKSFETAAIFYEKALTKDPGDMEARKEVTGIYCEKIKAGNKCFTMAEYLYKKFPNDPKITGWYKNSLWKFARSMYLQQRLDKASKYFKSYIKLDPTNGVVYYMLADAKFRSNIKPPRNDDALKEAIRMYKKAISMSKNDAKISSTFNSKKKQVLHWEAYAKIGTIYQTWINDAFGKWMKEQAAIQKKAALEQAKKKRRRRRRRRNPEVKKPKFPVNEKYFAAAMDIYKKAIKVPQSNKYKRTLPYIQMSFFYANYKQEYLESIKWLKKAEEEDDTNMSVVGNMKMIYDKLKEQAEKDKKTRLAKIYSKKSVYYDSKFASLKARQ